MAFDSHKLAEGNGFRNDFVYRRREPGEPFCDSEVREDLKFGAQHLGYCFQSLKF